MTTSAIGSSSSSATSAAFEAKMKQRMADMKSLTDALSSNDLSAAQSAFAKMQKDDPKLAKMISSSSTDSKNGMATAMKSLATALSNNDLSGAQSAMASLQSDMKSHAPKAGQTGQPPTPPPDADGDDDGSTSSSSYGSSGSVLNATA